MRYGILLPVLCGAILCLAEQRQADGGDLVKAINLEKLNSAADEERSEEHTSELQSRLHLVCRLLLEKKKSDPFAAPAPRTGLAADKRANTHLTLRRTTPPRRSLSERRCGSSASAPIPRAKPVRVTA